jgi:hypothetical protein
MPTDAAEEELPMATVQCPNGHNYDDRMHTFCPFCSVPGLKDVTIPGTQAAPMSRPGIPRTEPASALRSAPNRPGMPQTEPASASGAGGPIRGGRSADRSATPGVTVGIFQKHTGIDPVVGWLVCVKGVNKGRDYRLHSDLNKIGRAPNMDVCIEGDDAISREDHCRIAFSPRSKTFNIVPADSRNLSYLNDEDVLSAMRLKAYDRLDLGDSSFIFIPFEYDWESATKREPIGDEAPPEIKRPEEPRERPPRDETKVL